MKFDQFDDCHGKNPPCGEKAPSSLRLLKLSTGEEIIGALSDPDDEFLSQHFYFIECPLSVASRMLEDGSLERTMIPWTAARGNASEDWRMFVGKQFVVCVDWPFPDAEEAWKALSKKYIEAGSERIRAFLRKRMEEQHGEEKPGEAERMED
jgi:hypothetical protein